MSTPSPDEQPWGPQAGPGPGWGDPPVRRPGTVTGAAVVAIVFGSLVGLLNLVGLLASGSLDVDFGVADLALTVVVVALAVALVVGGIRVLTGREPQLLLYAGFGLIGLWLLGVVVSIADGRNPLSGFLTLVAGAVVVSLLRNPASRAWFASRDQRI